MKEELLNNPKKYRIGDNYRGTNIVFPVEFEGQKFIVKRPGTLASLANLYYTFQDKFFYGLRRLSNSQERFDEETRKLELLADIGIAPKVVAYDGKTIVREYLEGTDFRNLSSDQERRTTLEGAMEAMCQAHEKDVIIGDAHVKNTLLADIGKSVYWYDLDGVFDESDLPRAKAVDVLKFVYSTYSATKSEDAAFYSAEIASKHSDKKSKEVVKDLSTPGLSAVQLWLPVRLPLNDRLNKQIKRILQG